MEIVERLGLAPLDQEGGFFRRTFTSAVQIDNRCVQNEPDVSGSRPLGTVIQFLVTEEGFAAMHRLRSPEIWFFHRGDPLEMLLLHPDGSGQIATLGPSVEAGHHVQFTVPAGSWQGCLLKPSKDRHGYALCSAAVIPGFEWTDFELGEGDALARGWPVHAEAIRARVRMIPPQGRT